VAVHGTAKLFHLDVTRKGRNQSEGSYRPSSRNKPTCSEINSVIKIHPTNGVLHSQGNQTLRIGLLQMDGAHTYKPTEIVSQKICGDSFFLSFFLSTIPPFLVNAFLFSF
jgi:hypothetical protein